MMNVAKELVAVSRLVAEDGSPGLNGMNNREARKFVNKLLDRHTRGLFSDQYWTPVTKTFKELGSHGVEYSITKREYLEDRNGSPSAKVWTFEMEFVNDKGRATKLYGRITASGAGTVEDPLSRYDLVAFAS